MPVILVTGSNGQVGRELHALQQEFSDLDFHFTDRRTFDVTNPGNIHRFLNNNEVDYCVNCAAYTNVDKAESEEELAHLINVKGATNTAKACQERNIPLVQLSTEYVYHNKLNRPLQETDLTQPKGVYALTKYEGEQRAKALHPDTLTIRTSWVYSTFGSNFLKTMLALGKERDRVRVVFDQIGTPTYAQDLARAILEILRQRHQGKVSSEAWSAIYHYSNEGVASWYDFAVAIFERCGIHCKVEPITSKEYPTAARRPTYSLLDKAKIKSTFGIDIPYWRDSLQECLECMAGKD